MAVGTTYYITKHYVARADNHIIVLQGMYIGAYLRIHVKSNIVYCIAFCGVSRMSIPAIYMHCSLLGIRSKVSLFLIKQ